jgi:hypothetical protein
MAIRNDSARLAQLNRALPKEDVKAKTETKREEEEAPSDDKFEGAGRNVATGLQVAALQAKMQGGKSELDEALGDVRKRDQIGKDLEADKPGTAESVVDGLSSKDTFARYGAADLVQGAPEKFFGHEDKIAKAGAKEGLNSLRALSDAGSAKAGEHLDAAATAAPAGYSGDSTRAAAGVENRAWAKADAAKSAGHEPLTAKQLRESVHPDAEIRGPAMQHLADQAAKGHPQAVTALVEYTKGDAPGVRDHDLESSIEKEAAGALKQGGAEHLAADDAEALESRASLGSAGAVLDAASASGNAHVTGMLREDIQGSVKYGHTKDREAASLVKDPDAPKADFDLALKAGGIPGLTNQYGGKETGHAREAVGDALKAGNANARAAVEDGFASKDFRVRSNAHAAAEKAPEQIGERGVANLKARAGAEKYASEELETLEKIGSFDTKAGAAARDALSDLSAKHPRAKDMLARAELKATPSHEKPLEELRRGPLTPELGDRVVRGFDKLDKAQQREAIDLLKGSLDGKHPDTDGYNALGKLAPHLTQQDVQDIARSTLRMPQLADRDAEKYYSSHVQAAKNGYKQDVGRMAAKRDAMRSILEKGASADVKNAAFDGLVDHKYDRMDKVTTRALAGHAGETGDVERGLKLQDRVPDAKVIYPKDAHRQVAMSDERARAVLSDPNKWAQLDGHNGARPEGRLSAGDLKRAAADPALPPDVRAAAGHLARSGRGVERGQIATRPSEGFRYDREGDACDFRTEHKANGTSTTTTEYQLGRQVREDQRFSRAETLHRVEEGVETKRGFKRESLHETRTRPEKAGDDVEGSNFVHGIFFSDSPQDLRDELKGSVKKEVTTTRSEPRYGAKRSSTTERYFTRDSRGQIDKEVVKLSRDGAQNQWIAKKKNADGSYDTQSFIQGTEDTVLTRSKKTGGWDVKTSEARMGDTREAVQEANREKGTKIPVPPAKTNHVEASKDDATVPELRRKLRDLGLSEATSHKAYERFAAQMEGKKFSVAYERTTDSDGKDQSVLVAEAKDGTRLAIATDPKTGGVASQADLGDDLAVQSSSQGRERLDIEVRSTEDGFEAFVSENGGAFKRSPEITSELAEARGTLGHTKTAIDRTKDVVKVTGRVGRRAGTAMRGAIDRISKSKRFGRFTKGLDKGIVGISVVSGVLAMGEMASGIANGDAKQFAQGASGLAVDSSNAIFGVADLMQRTGKVSSTSSRLASTLKFSKWLGVTGGVAGMGFGVNDLMNGETFKGTVGIIGGGATIATAVGSYAGSAAAAGTVWSTMGWMGPVGAITALAATGLLAGYGHVEGTKIAEPEIF